LTDIEIMHAGIVPVDVPVKPDLASVGIVQDQIGYRVGGLIFVNEQDAMTAAAMDLLDEKTDYNIGWTYKWFEPCMDKRVEKVMAYSQEAVMRCAKALQENEQKRGPYEKAQRTYSEYLAKTGAIRQAIRATIVSATEKQREIKLAAETMEKYLALADGNVETARKFFRNTYKNRPDIIATVIGETQVEAK
jgi:hypothetical protein